MTAKIRREIKEHPEKFDFQDVPPARKKIPEQEAWFEEHRPQWAKDMLAATDEGE
jgi:hypothetical protein